MKYSALLLGAVLSLAYAGVLRAEVAPPVAVDIDVKPGSAVNSINVKSHGTTPVALLCSSTFDPVTVDTSTVVMGTDASTSGATAQHCALEDINGDGCLDLVCHFATQDLGVVCGVTELSIAGLLTDGTPLTGTDTIVTVPCKP